MRSTTSTDARITRSGRGKFNFLGLPIEIRYQIYKYLLPGRVETVHVLGPQNRARESSWPKDLFANAVSVNGVREPDLLSLVNIIYTNRQIYHETQSVRPRHHELRLHVQKSKPDVSQDLSPLASKFWNTFFSDSLKPFSSQARKVMLAGDVSSPPLGREGFLGEFPKLRHFVLDIRGNLGPDQFPMLIDWPVSPPPRFEDAPTWYAASLPILYGSRATNSLIIKAFELYTLHSRHGASDCHGQSGELCQHAWHDFELILYLPRSTRLSEPVPIQDGRSSIGNHVYHIIHARWSRETFDARRHEPMGPSHAPFRLLCDYGRCYCVDDITQTKTLLWTGRKAWVEEK